MPDPSTTRLALYKSKSDGSEPVNYTQDIGQNLDKIDTAVGFQAVTSSTRPSSPYSGKPIMETDTSYRSYFSNGTAPASASWVEIPNSSGTYGGNLAMALGKQLNIGGSGSTAAYAIRLTDPVNDYVISSRIVGDSSSRFTTRADGQLGWGPGTSGTDVFLARSGTATVTVTGNLTVTGIGQTQYIAKTADETVTSSTTLQDDNHLVLPAVANAVYTFALDLYMIDAGDFTGDFKMSFTCPTGATFDMHGAGAHSGDLTTGTSSNGEWIAKLATTSAGANLTFGCGNTSATGVRVYGRLVMGGTAGNLQLQWAQNASDVSGTTLKAGSYMAMTRVA